MDKTEFLKERAGPSGLAFGASDVATAIGVNPKFATPYAFYEKLAAAYRGEPFERREDNPAPCQHGDRCEPLVGAAYQAAMGGAVVEMLPGRVERHVLDAGMHKWRGCTVDYTAVYEDGTRVDVECKSPYGQMYKVVSDAHRVQCLDAMWQKRTLHHHYVAALFPHAEEHKRTGEPPDVPWNPLTQQQADSFDQLLALAAWDIPRDDRLLEEFIVPRWMYIVSCVVAQTPPPVDLWCGPNGSAPHTVPPDVRRTCAWASNACLLPEGSRGCEIVKIL